MKETYRLDGNELPTIPTPHDCVVKEIRLEGRNLVFAFEDDLSVHDAFCVQERGAKSLIMTFHLLSDAYDITVLQWKRPPLGRLFHRPGAYKEVDIVKHPERLSGLAAANLEYLYHNVGYRSVIIKLWSRGSIILDIAADAVELEWIVSEVQEETMQYKVTIDGCDDAEQLKLFHGLEKLLWEPGETVSFHVVTATDTSYRVTSAQVAVHNEGYNVGGTSTYSFTMPEEDVDVTVESYNSMMNPFMTNPPMSFMGQAPMNMSDLMSGGVSNDAWLEAGKRLLNGEGTGAPVAAPAEPAADEHPWEGKPAFCAECGASTKHSDKYCTECGARLLPKE